MTMPKIQFRFATMSDSQLLFDWRNDPMTRRASFEGQSISREDHNDWLSETIQSSDRHLYIGGISGIEIGTVRFDRHPGDWQELSWTIAPEQRNQGIGRKMVAAAIELADKQIMARILPDNHASIRIAQSCGFARQNSTSEFQVWSREKEPRIAMINDRILGPGNPPFIVAEMSANHLGSLVRAREIVAMAADAGADAIKLQTYTPDTITIDGSGPEFHIKNGPWSGSSLYELDEKAHTPWAWHAELFDYAKSLGLGIFSSPFDSTAIDLLEDLDAPAYKIASCEIVDHELIARVSKTGKPIIMSCGMASCSEVAEAVSVAQHNSSGSIILLHCVSGYPTPPDEVNLLRLKRIAESHNVLVGLSDHTLGTTVAVASVALGACLIEKHVTLRRSDGGPDAQFSLEPHELQELVRNCRTTWDCLGDGNARLAPSETQTIPFRRSLYVVKNIKRGEIFTRDHIRSIRPGLGLKPKHLGEVLGHRAACTISRGTALDWSLVSRPEERSP